jgi:hypothetical protein
VRAPSLGITCVDGAGVVVSALASTCIRTAIDRLARVTRAAVQLGSCVVPCIGHGGIGKVDDATIGQVAAGPVVSRHRPVRATTRIALEVRHETETSTELVRVRRRTADEQAKKREADAHRSFVSRG